MNNIIESIKKYKPYNEQEEKDKDFIINFILNNKNCLFRENKVAHLTASSWIVNKDFTKVIMVYHKIYDSWSWTGGHADGDSDLLKVSIKEAKEETGLTNIKVLSNEIYSLEVLTVDGHVKKGAYVSSHLHLNLTYLLQADESEALKIKEDENKGVKWFSLQDAIDASTEEWFKEHIYNKLNKKLNNYIH